MAKYKLQELTDMRNEGKRRVYPKIVTNRTLSRKEFIKRMQSYHRGISESTTEAVLLDVADMYNPQNEAFLHSRTSRAISQNETYRRNTPCPPLKNRPAYAGIHIL